MASPPARLSSIALAVLLTFCAFSCRAQDASDDATQMANEVTHAAEQDAKDVLGNRAEPPEASKDTPPAGVREGDNAGTANFSTHSEGHSETFSEGSSQSSDSGMSSDNDNRRNDNVRDTTPRAGEISNNPPPPAGWPGHDRANRPSAGMQSINAGPIWNNNDAQGKCPNVCENNQLRWTGDWRTTGFNRSECDCSPYGNQAQSRPQYSGRGSGCSAPANGQCRGCSVSCPAGSQAHCTQGDRGIFTRADSVTCQTDAVCECR